MSAGVIAHLRRSLRTARRFLGWALLTLVIAAALCVGLASQLLPLLGNYPDTVARWLAKQIGEPVSLTAVEARWNRAGPELSLSGLRIGALPHVLDVGRAELQVNVYAGLWPAVALTELRLSGLELELRRGSDRYWRLDGFGRSSAPSGESSQLDQLERFGVVDVVDARLRFHDAIGDFQFDLPHVDARLQRRAGRLQFGALLHHKNDAHLRIAGDVARGARSGTVYLEGLEQDWAAWAQDVALYDIRLTEARGDIRAWLDFSEHAPTQLQVETSLASLVLGGRAVTPEKGEPNDTVHFSSWKMDLRLQYEADGSWDLLLPVWQVGGENIQADGVATKVDVVREAHIRHDAAGLLRAQADQVRLGTLLSLARLAPPKMPESLHQWLAVAAPQGTLRHLRLLWQATDNHSFEARLEDVSWSPYAGIPALHGISGLLDGDAQAIRLQLASGTWGVQAPDMLRAPFVPQVSGEIMLFHAADGLRIETPELHLYEDSYDIMLAGGVQLPEEGGALLDLRADVAEAPIIVAKRFWPINVMPSAAVDWLDRALLDGRVTRGGALIRGNVKDWPFRQGEGRFEAFAELADTRLLFHQDWLPGQQLEGVVRFVNTGMDVDLRGQVGGATVSQARGGIPDFGDAVLQLEIQGAGTGPALLDVLRRSPLQESYGEYMQGLSLSGNGAVTLALRIPLEEGLGEPRVDGHVDIARMDLHDSGWGLDFEAASGRVRFSELGFSADELNVGFSGGLAALSIAVGDYTSSNEHLAEASLRGRLQAADLIASNARSGWLGPWFEGESDWTLQLTVPETTASTPVTPKLRIRSDLVGTAISLPAPLRKAKDDPLPLDMKLGLPLETSRLDIRLGRLLHLFGRTDETNSFTGLALFGEAPEVSMPARGLHIGGQIPVLDLAAWGAVVADGGVDGDAALVVDSVDILAGELNILDRPFRETRVRMNRDATRVEIDLEGEALDGRLTIPVDGLVQKGITGRFRRLHWPEAPENGATPDKSSDTVFYPATIPPLHLESAETSFSGAQLGSLWLETYPTADGLHVERLDAHSAAFDIKAKGDWLNNAQGERSELALDFSTGDAGGMLSALGFSRLIDGGATHGQLRLSWPGAPGAFDWGVADGELSISIGKGRVLEVEPGAGRLFGLLSLTEIPRRLMLDFSDFFKSGLAFNQMAGAFDIQQGDAVTGDFRIDAPSAVVLLRGRTGLKARDYDQTLEVMPKAGSVLPALGALAGGPAGAAVGAVAQAMLREPLRDATRATYRVTGPWTEPQIELLERENTQN